MTTEKLYIDGHIIEIIRKNIKNLHLRVSSADGHIRLTAPLHVKNTEIKSVITARLDWIKTQQLKLANRPVIATNEYITGEYHYFQGQRYLLEVIYYPKKPIVSIVDQQIYLYVRNGSDSRKREQVLKTWYMEQLHQLIPQLIAKWQPIIGVQVADWGVKQMKTRWGTCNIRDRRIWLALGLAQKPFACLEYVVVHEMVHLLERYHNDRFKAFMTQFLPNWPQLKHELNQLSTHILDE